MNPNKSPGPDGFNGCFFQKAWLVIGDDVVAAAVKEFFSSGSLLMELNSTIITLVPKVANPTTMSDFRPISCCNTFYKIIAKLLANRLKDTLHLIVGPSQSAFIPGRRIGDNILLAQEILRDYHKADGQPRCTFMVDIMKANDTVEWDFIIATLQAFNIPSTLIGWIKSCISSPKFSVCVNGELAGFFASRRGLRQGDPLSPYLFVIAMEVLSLCIQRRINCSPCFRYHWRCDQLNLSHLCFADDLLMFCNGDENSVRTLHDAFSNFESLSSLKANVSESKIFLAGVDGNSSDSVLQVTNFSLGTCPVRYLGIPLITSKLRMQDCSPLLDRIETRIKSWENKVLSFAGRLQLIQSVLSSIQVYWASHLILPKKVLKDIEKRLRCFLWAGNCSGRAVTKVAWSEICLPKYEGGLGIKDLHCWNKALMISHIWNLVSSSSNFWTDWVKVYLLKGNSFWNAPLPSICSWNWRKLLKIRELCCSFFVNIIGDGRATSLWFDNWHPLGPLTLRWSSNIIGKSGLSKSAMVSDVICNNLWRFPSLSRELLEIRVFLTHIIPNSEVSDVVRWTLAYS
ncbi:hypothetical protein ACLB2K_022292 [Fragaria x ananassa]